MDGGDLAGNKHVCDCNGEAFYNGKVMTESWILTQLLIALDKRSSSSTGLPLFKECLCKLQAAVSLCLSDSHCPHKCRE